MVDMGEANGRAFVGIVSVGFDSVVNEEANRSRLLRGEAVYVWTAVRLLAGWRHARFRMTIDESARETRGYAVGVANSGAYGGGMLVVPDAQLDDGRLDAFAFEAHRKVRFLREIPKRRSGGHVDNPAYNVVRGSTVTIEADRPFPVYADGEPIGSLPVEVRVCPSCLRVVAQTSPSTS
jgi:diacylglycerol kinase family enzyme